MFLPELLRFFSFCFCLIFDIPFVYCFVSDLLFQISIVVKKGKLKKEEKTGEERNQEEAGRKRKELFYFRIFQLFFSLIFLRFISVSILSPFRDSVCILLCS